MEHRWSPREGTPELSDSEKEVRRSFVHEYLKDYDALNACLRLGYHGAFARTFARRFMEEGYVRSYIIEVERSNKTEKERADSRISDMELILSTLRDVMIHGSPAARVRAASEMANAYNLAESMKQNSAAASGVMVVPGISSISEWEQAAIASQSSLMSDSATD